MLKKNITQNGSPLNSKTAIFGVSNSKIIKKKKFLRCGANKIVQQMDAFLPQ